jgi:tetratricopeptide (TPR) repeat protein
MTATPLHPTKCLRKRISNGAFTACALVLFSPAVFGAKAPPKSALPQPSQAPTVEELVHESAKSLASGNWQATVEHCNALLGNYGDKPEVMRIKNRIELTLLRCHLQLEQWNHAAPLFEVALRVLANAPPIACAEILLQKSSCELRIGQNADALKSVEASLAILPREASLRARAVLLHTQCLVACGSPGEAGALVEKELPFLDAAHLERALPIGMRALLEADQPGRAFLLFTNASQRFQGCTEIVGVQFALLQTGSALLAQAELNQALVCFKHLSTPERVIAAQRLQIHLLEGTAKDGAEQTATHTPKTEASQNRARQLRAELDAFGDGVAFALATQIQTASAYNALGRTHEAALTLEHLIQRNQPSETLESTSVELTGLWTQLERWEKVVSVTERFVHAHPSSRHLPLMLYLRGCAQQKAGQLKEARDTFVLITKEYKNHELSPSARFMRAQTLLMDGNPADAAKAFSEFLHTHKKHALSDAANHGLCTALALAGLPAEVRAASDRYLTDFPDGEYRAPVRLKRAQSLSALGDKASSLRDLEAVLSETPDHSCAGETALLLGDNLLALGQTEAAMVAWQRVPTTQAEAREDALLKCAKVLYRLGKPQEVRKVLQSFSDLHSHSARLGEAAHWIWKAAALDGYSTTAMDWTLSLLNQCGNDPRAAGIEPLLYTAGAHASADQNRARWSDELHGLAKTAGDSGETTLAARLRWAIAKQSCAHDKSAAQMQLVEIAEQCPPDKTGPTVLADGATAMEACGKQKDARRLWRELLRWHPRNPQREEALSNLARLDLEMQQHESALEWIHRFERGSKNSPLLPRLLLLNARIQQGAGKYAEALESLERVLRLKNARASSKCEALFRIGEHHAANRAPKLAIQYLQRVYVSYGTFQPWAAKAYLASAEAFLTLGDRTAARNTYQEMLSSPLSEDSPERATAKTKLKTLEEIQ